MRSGKKRGADYQFRTEGVGKGKPVIREKRTPPPTLGKVAKKAGKIGVAMYAASALKDAYANRNKPKPKGKAK